MDVSPFDPQIVFAWGETPEKAIKKAAAYFKKLGFDVKELTARHTGLTQPSAYKDTAFEVNTYEQSQRAREDTPSLKRFLVKRK